MVLLRRLVLAAWMYEGCASTPTPLVLDGTAVSLSLTNRMNETVCHLFISPPGEDRWSDDILGSATIAAGATRDVRVPRGVWDLRAESCSRELMGVMRTARITRATTLVIQ